MKHATFWRQVLPDLMVSTAASLFALSIAFPAPPRAPAISCHASQPVYTGTRLAGTWNATLAQGQSVTLPDGDTATCTARGLYVH